MLDGTSFAGLAKDGVDRYYGREIRDEGLTVVEAKTVAAGTIDLLDSNAVDVYLSPVAFATNSAPYFDTNRTVARAQALARPVVKIGRATLKGTLA